MNKSLLLLLIAALLVVSAAYSLDRGVFVGSERVFYGPAPCAREKYDPKTNEWSPVLPGEKAQCTDDGYIQKRCRYLFITGISTINAYDGTVQVAHMLDLNELRAAFDKPENGYCRLFAPDIRPGNLR